MESLSFSPNANVQPLHHDGHRESVKFAPSAWSDFFVTFNPLPIEKRICLQERCDKVKEEVRKTLEDHTEEPHEMINLVYSLDQLGLGYHYEHEIEQLVWRVYNSSWAANEDLLAVSLGFYVLRSHGFRVSPDVFLKFRDANGKFTCKDTKSVIALYNAAYLRIRGEKILDEAIVFAKSYLELVLAEPNKASEPIWVLDEARYVLETPLSRRVARLEMRRYITTCDKQDDTHIPDKKMMELAKLDFNLLQAQHCDELKLLTKWWNDLDLMKSFNFARNRLVESYFWAVTGAFYEPQYSRGRIMSAKFITLLTLIDDMYDNYGTTEEGKLFVLALDRWEEEGVDQLPEYMQDFFLKVLKSFKDFEIDLSAEEQYQLAYFKKALMPLIYAYSKESEWRDRQYIPKTVKEHLEVSGPSTGCMTGVCCAMLGMKPDIATSEAFEWVINFSRIVTALSTICRLVDDITSTQREQQMKHVYSTVHSCMLEHNIGMKEACDKLRAVVESEWMVVNEECLQPRAQPWPIMARALNYTRSMEMVYKHADGFTFADVLSDKIKSVLVDPIPI